MSKASQSGEQPILSLDALLAADDRPEQTIPVPEWGGSVKIKALSLGAFTDATEAATVADKVDQQKLAVEMLVRGVIDPPLEPKHVALLREKSIGAVTRVMGAIAALSAVTDADSTAAERRFPDAAE